MRNKISMFLVKTYFSFKGYRIKSKLIRENLVLINKKDTSEGLVLKTYKPLKKRLFKVNTQCCEKTSGITMFNETTQEIKYWVIGVLVGNNELKINSEWRNF